LFFDREFIALNFALLENINKQKKSFKVFFYEVYQYQQKFKSESKLK